jgi:GrpB-like predicted nucleotidyltransferase (UPF0157 family)
MLSRQPSLRLGHTRDYLRTHQDVADKYHALKRRLALVHRLDREAYTRETPVHRSNHRYCTEGRAML